MFEEDDYYREELPDLRGKTVKKLRNCFTLETLKDYLPILRWLPKYKRSYIPNDVVAGLTVALIVIPQSLANASIAGLPPQYGLYSAILGPLIYILFGTNKNVIVGPTTILALMLPINLAHNVDLSALLALMSGCILLGFAILKLGIVVQLVSMPVIQAFLIGGALSIGSTQINNICGIPGNSGNFVHAWIHFFSNLHKIQWRDTVLGISTLIALIGLQSLKNLQWKYKILTYYGALSSNACGVIGGTLLCYMLRDGSWLPFTVSGKIATGLPEIQVPDSATLNGKHLDFTEMLSHLGGLLITIPLVSTFQCFVALKSFSKGETINASQELIAISLSNIFGSFLGSMPVTSAFIHTAVNSATGVSTQLGGGVAAIIVILTLAFLEKTFYFTPKPSLAAVNIAAMIPFINMQKIIDIWRARKIDMIPFVVTLVACLCWSFQSSLLVGIVVNLLFILWRNLRPNISITKDKANGVGILMVNIECFSLDYISSEYIIDKIMKCLTRDNSCGSIQMIILDGAHIKAIDSTAAKNILTLMEDLQVLKCELICWNWPRKAASVIWRLDKTTRWHMFKMSTSIEELIILPANGNNSSLEDR